MREEKENEIGNKMASVRTTSINDTIYRNSKTGLLNNPTGPSIIVYNGNLYFYQEGKLSGIIHNTGVYVSYDTNGDVAFSMDMNGKNGYRKPKWKNKDQKSQ